MQEIYNDFLLCWNNLPSNDIMDFGEYVFVSGATIEDSIGNRLFRLYASEAMVDISGYK